MERWKPAPEFEGIYEVSTEGGIRSVDRVDSAGRRRIGRRRIPQVGKRGYPVINLRKDGRDHAKKLHHLVAVAFLGPPPAPFGPGPGECEVNHKDGNPLNPRVENLEYLTRLANIRHAYDSGLMDNAIRPGERNGRARLTDASVIEIRRLYRAGGVTIPQLAARYGVCKSTVGYAVNGVTWRHLS